MMAKLVAAAKTAGPQAKITMDKTVSAAICDVMKKNGGYVQPADMYHPFPSPSPGPGPGPAPKPTPPTPPAPVPAKCKKLLEKNCPGPFKTPTECLICTREIENVDKSCHPKDRHAFCGEKTGLLMH